MFYRKRVYARANAGISSDVYINPRKASKIEAMLKYIVTVATPLIIVAKGPDAIECMQESSTSTTVYSSIDNAFLPVALEKNVKINVE
jgi:hypothetical protein